SRLPAPSAADGRSTSRREPNRLFRSPQKRACLLARFLILEFRIGVRDYTTAGLNIHRAILDQGGTQGDAGIHRPVGGKVADTAAIDVAAVGFELLDDLHRANLWRS